jgi:predicted ArsR family transcriptional regulator
MYEHRDALLNAATPDRIKTVADKLAELAADGDVQAAKVWLEYTCGRPAQALELSGPGDEPLTSLDVGVLVAILVDVLRPYGEDAVHAAAAQLNERLKCLIDASGDDAAADAGEAEPGPASDP